MKTYKENCKSDLKKKNSTPWTRFTTSQPTQLPLELNDLLNKGTNFIPTLDNTETKHFKKTINTEINQALCTVIKKQNPSVGKLKVKKSTHHFQPYLNENPHKLLKQELNRPHFNLHIVDYLHNTTTHTKQFLQRPPINSLLQRQQTNITPDQFNYIQQLQNGNDIILTLTNKNMGWALVPISWFQNEYKTHFSDNETYPHIDTFDMTATIRHSNTILRQLTARFKTNLLADRRKRQLLYCVNDRQLQLPFMKLPKVHKLDNPASTTNLTKLTGRPIIIAHSWITSNPSRLLGQELDSIILQLKTYFDTNNIPFPLIYNSSELLDKLQQTYMEDITSYSLHLTSLDCTQTFHITIPFRPLSPAEIYLTCLTYTRIAYLTLIISLINAIFSGSVILFISRLRVLQWVVITAAKWLTLFYF